MTAEEIRRVYEHTGYLMDPHTAVASRVLGDYREATGDHTPTVIVATASPYKFASDVLSALLGPALIEGLTAFECAQRLSAHTGVPIPRQISELQTLPIRHTAVCDKDGMEEAVFAQLR